MIGQESILGMHNILGLIEVKVLTNSTRQLFKNG